MGKVNGKYSLSYWEQSTFFNDVDIAVIGSGIVGLSVAICLKEKQPNLKVIILERGPLPIGASTRNAGFACFGSISELVDDLDTGIPENELWELVEMRWKGLLALKNKFGARYIRFEHLGGYELFRSEEEEVYHRCMEYLPYFNKVLKRITGYEATYIPASHKVESFGFSGIRHLILNQAEGQIHTGALMQTMLLYAKKLGIEVFNGIKVKAVQSINNKVSIVTKHWDIEAGRVILATNGFAKQLINDLPVSPARNQVLITEPIPNLRFKGTFHYDRGYYYFRNVDQRILLGGGRHLSIKGETTDEFGTTPLIRAALTRILREHIVPYRSLKIDHWWSGIMGIGNDKRPILSMVRPHIFVAVRLGGMGVAIGHSVGQEAANMVLKTY